MGSFGPSVCSFVVVFGLMIMWCFGGLFDKDIFLSALSGFCIFFKVLVANDVVPTNLSM